jgi:hypothetical protein
MGRLTGFEPATSGTTNRRSNQLSYNRHSHCREPRQIGSRACRSSVIGAGERLLHRPGFKQSENCFRAGLTQLYYEAVRSYQSES